MNSFNGLPQFGIPVFALPSHSLPMIVVTTSNFGPVIFQAFQVNGSSIYSVSVIGTGFEASESVSTDIAQSQQTVNAIASVE